MPTCKECQKALSKSDTHITGSRPTVRKFAEALAPNELLCQPKVTEIMQDPYIMESVPFEGLVHIVSTKATVSPNDDASSCPHFAAGRVWKDTTPNVTTVPKSKDETGDTHRYKYEPKKSKPNIGLIIFFVIVILVIAYFVFF